MKVKVIDREGVDHFQIILEKLQSRFLATKRNNPRGYLDQFESQMEGHLVDIVSELGGNCEQDGEEVVCRFV